MSSSGGGAAGPRVRNTCAAAAALGASVSSAVVSALCFFTACCLSCAPGPPSESRQAHLSLDLLLMHAMVAWSSAWSNAHKMCGCQVCNQAAAQHAMQFGSANGTEAAAKSKAGAEHTFRRCRLALFLSVLASSTACFESRFCCKHNVLSLRAVALQHMQGSERQWSTMCGLHCSETTAHDAKWRAHKRLKTKRPSLKTPQMTPHAQGTHHKL